MVNTPFPDRTLLVVPGSGRSTTESTEMAKPSSARRVMHVMSAGAASAMGLILVVVEPGESWSIRQNLIPLSLGEWVPNVDV